MAVNTRQYPTGYVDPHCFERNAADFFTYHSPIQYRSYELHYIQIGGAYQWNCNCPDARYISHKEGKPCKHEKALAILQWQHEKRKAETELATDIAAEQNEVAILRAEVAALRAELAEARTAQATRDTPDLSEILQEIVALKAENAEIKKALATKATARKKHQTEQEAADIKRQINTVLDDVVAQAENTIQAAAMARQQIKDLEAIPHCLKAELDAWTEQGKEELQPDYKAPDHNAPEIKALVRGTQEAERKRRDASAEERRKMAPLNGNQSFSFYR